MINVNGGGGIREMCVQSKRDLKKEVGNDLCANLFQPMGAVTMEAGSLVQYFDGPHSKGLILSPGDGSHLVKVSS